MMNTYYVEDLVRLTANFEQLSDDAPIDPTTVAVTITRPDDTVITPPLTHDAPGVYHVDVIVDQRGVWSYVFQGEGLVIASSGLKLFRAT
jgi:hypothetical protein